MSTVVLDSVLGIYDEDTFEWIFEMDQVVNGVYKLVQCSLKNLQIAEGTGDTQSTIPWFWPAVSEISGALIGASEEPEISTPFGLKIITQSYYIGDGQNALPEIKSRLEAIEVNGVTDIGNVTVTYPLGAFNDTFEIGVSSSQVYLELYWDQSSFGPLVGKSGEETLTFGQVSTIPLSDTLDNNVFPSFLYANVSPALGSLITPGHQEHHFYISVDSESGSTPDGQTLRINSTTSMRVKFYAPQAAIPMVSDQLQFLMVLSRQ